MQREKCAPCIEHAEAVRRRRASPCRKQHTSHPRLSWRTLGNGTSHPVSRDVKDSRRMQSFMDQKESAAWSILRDVKCCWWIPLLTCAFRRGTNQQRCPSSMFRSSVRCNSRPRTPTTKLETHTLHTELETYHNYHISACALWGMFKEMRMRDTSQEDGLL